jgi:hypothetical protein
VNFRKQCSNVTATRCWRKYKSLRLQFFVRLEELASSSDDHGEREAIANAASTIAVVADRSKLSKATLLQYLLH